MPFGHLEGCTLYPGDGHPVCYEGSRRLGERPEVACPAWADGQHCFVQWYFGSDGIESISPEYTGGAGVRVKRCACGATVERTK